MCWFMTWNFRNNLGLFEVVKVIEILRRYTVSPKGILPEQMPAVGFFFFFFCPPMYLESLA